MACAGIFFMISALVMNTTHGGVHNIGLISEKNNLMLFGGFIFIGGLALLGFSKNTPSNEKQEATSTNSNQQNPISKNVEKATYWWKNQSQSKKAVTISCLITIVSALSNWTYIRTAIGESGANTIHRVFYEDIGQGFGFEGFLLLCLWIYPLINYFKNNPPKFIPNVACITIALVLSVWHLIDILTDSRNTEHFRDLTGGDYIRTGIGIWLFIISCIGYLSGFLTQKLQSD